ncbi:hypothetical protein K456DRAFT_1942770, partial [Colletotrichum gloeosporioides 23]
GEDAVHHAHWSRDVCLWSAQRPPVSALVLSLAAGVSVSYLSGLIACPACDGCLAVPAGADGDDEEKDMDGMESKARQGAPYGGFDAGNGPWGSIHGGPAFAPAPSQSLPSTLHAPCTFREYSRPTTTTPLGNQPGGSVRGAPEGPRSTTTGKGRKKKKEKKKDEAGGRAS